MYKVIGSSVQRYYPSQYNHDNPNISSKDQTTNDKNDKEYISITNIDPELSSIVNMLPEYKAIGYFKMLKILSLPSLTEEKKKELYLIIFQQKIEESVLYIIFITHALILNIFDFLLLYVIIKDIPKKENLNEKSYEKLRLKFPGLMPTNNIDKMKEEYNTLENDIYSYFEKYIMIFNTIFSILLSIESCQNETFFRFYDIVSKNFLPLLLIILKLILMMTVFQEIKISKKIFLMHSAFKLLYLLLINIIDYYKFYEKNKKYNEITEKINIILKNKKYDPINGIMAKEEDVKTLQEFLLGL